MPKELEKKLMSEASSRGYTGKRKSAFVYGTLRKTGWKPKREKSKKIIKKASSYNT